MISKEEADARMHQVADVCGSAGMQLAKGMVAISSDTRVAIDITLIACIDTPAARIFRTWSPWHNCTPYQTLLPIAADTVMQMPDDAMLIWAGLLTQVRVLPSLEGQSPANEGRMFLLATRDRIERSATLHLPIVPDGTVGDWLPHERAENFHLGKFLEFLFLADMSRMRDVINTRAIYKSIGAYRTGQ